MNLFHNLKISEKKSLTNNATLLTFDVPLDLKDNFNFISGQYLTLNANIDGSNLRRSYSICSSPHENQLAIVVKAINKGIFSNFVKNNIKVGDCLEVGVPEGRFNYKINSEETKKVFLIAAGSGITPIISIIKNILFNEPNSEVTLLYANKTKEDIIFFENLEDLSLQFPDRLQNIYVFSRAEYENYHFGRINRHFLENKINNKLDFKSFSEFYNCGPESLTNEVKNYLESLGISKEKIKSELFYALEMASEQDQLKSGIFENTTVEVIINEESFFVKVQNKKNLLDELLDEGLDVPYSCKKGNCSSCVAKVISGSIEMNKTTVLLDEELRNGFILSCQSFSTSSNLVISYDEY